MTEGERPPRSPARVAVMAFGAVVLVGIVVIAIIGGISGNNGMTPFQRGEAAGQALTPIALIAAAIGYVVQKRRLDKR